MKYRRNKVKREHSIIHGALAWLEELTQYPEVTDIIPGVIEANRSPERGIVYKYETQTGCKLLLKSNGSIQEAFVVTKNPAWVKAWVEEHFPQASVDTKENDVREQSPQGQARAKARTQSKSHLQGGEVSQSSPLGNRSRRRRSTNPSKRDHKDVQWSAGELDTPSLGENISPQMRSALRRLQKELDTKKRKQ